MRVPVLRVLLAVPSGARRGWTIDGETSLMIEAFARRQAAVGFFRLVVMAAALLFSGVSLYAEDAPPQIAALIDRLDADDYFLREEAMRRLTERADITTVQRLVEAFKSGSSETSWRAANVLRRLATSQDLATCDATVTALEELVDAPQTQIGRRADGLLQVVGPTVNQRAVKLLQRWGGEIRTVQVAEEAMVDVRIAGSWNGGDSALAHLARLQQLGALHLSHESVTNHGLEVAAVNRDVISLYLAGSSVDGDGLVHVGRLRGLRHLSLKGRPIDDASLAHLSQSKTLEGLGLDETPIGDEALPHLQGLPNLRVLWLNRTRVTDQGLAQLKDLPKLEKIVLTETSLEGPGLEHLAKLPSLRYLSLQGVPLRDGAMPYLGRVTQLTSLGLDGTRVGDAGLKYLASLKNLKVLWLNDTRVTDAGLVHLEKLISAESILLPGTKVSPEGVRRLRNALPKCRVVGPDGG